MRPSLILACLLAGCLGEATVNNNNDFSATVFDLAEPPNVDLLGAPDFGGASNCVQLNACEQACKDQKCVMDCRTKATPSAISKEAALQGCFNQYCPQNTDGSGGVCMDPTTQACKDCLKDSQTAPANMCINMSAPECHQCYTQATACVADK